MRILVCGSRDWNDYRMISDALIDNYSLPFVVIEGEARGADRMAAEWAERWHQPVELLRFPANWNKYGRAAGMIRNQQMLDEGKPDLVLAFHDDLEHSKGTKDMVNRARRAGIEVRVIRHAV